MYSIGSIYVKKDLKKSGLDVCLCKDMEDKAELFKNSVILILVI